MTIAEIHGKLRVKNPGGVSERLEDLLTSDVFSTMKYAGYETGFMDWLRSATSPIDNTTARDLLPIDQSGNQIADQVNSFPVQYHKRKKLPIVKRVHLYITAHFICPTNIYEEAITHIQDHDVVLFWLNWQSLINYLQPQSVTDLGKQEMIHDLAHLMKRKRLVLFRGFIQSPPLILEDWDGRGFWSRKKMKWWNRQPPTFPTDLHFWRE